MKKGALMKFKFLKIMTFSLALSLFFSSSVFAKDTAFSWSTPRNGHRQPVFPREAAAVSEYGAYYIDKSHGDNTEEKVLYLTFDAGYENGNIARILDTMKEKDVRGAFFVLDHLIIDNKNLLKRMKDEGHLICNHTKSHKDLTKCTDEEIKNDLEALETVCRDNMGFTLDRYFRFPEGKYSIRALKTVSLLGYKTVFWSFGYEDWDNNRQPSAEFAFNKIISNTHNGAVILLHPTSKTNADIFPRLIDKWREMGYRFGTLDELVNSNQGIS